MHPTIKKFTVSGETRDNILIAQRDLLDHEMIYQMREEGYVPVLGLGPLFSTVYDRDRDMLKFDVSYYGVRVGKKKSWDLEGMDLSGRMLPRTRPSRSEPSSEELES